MCTGICIGMMVGLVLGFVIGNIEIQKSIHAIESVQTKYNFALGMSDRCAISAGVWEPPFDFGNSFSYLGYREGYNTMDELIVQKQRKEGNTDPSSRSVNSQEETDAWVPENQNEIRR